MVEVDGRPGPGRVLEQFVVINAAGRLILQAITPADRRGRRVVETESVPDAARLMRRLAELVAELCARDAILEAAE